MKIVTDCAADLSTEEAQSLGVEVAPLYITFPEGEVDSNQITPDEFYQRLEDMQPQIPTTAHPSEGNFAELYKKLSAMGEEILSIHISSGLSGTANAARLAAKQIASNLVNVVDSMTLSGGERFQVLAAARAIKAGWNKAAILERLEAIRKATEVVYTLDTLSYLARGGRIGRVQALAGSLLNIKPIIHVDSNDGKYSTVGKARTMARAMDQIGDHLARLYNRETPVWVSVVHGKFEEQAHALADILKERLNVGRMEILRISPVLGVHTGPKIVGAVVVPMKLMDEISPG
jgi:DegV family protein with EDD domain